MEVIIKSPNQLSNQDLTKFQELLEMSGEVTSVGLSTRIQKAKKLLLIKDDDKIIGIAAIKNPYKSYRNHVFLSANQNDEADDYDYELGWIYILPDYRNKGISNKIMNGLKPFLESHNVFATTRKKNKTMNNILKKFGFVVNGVPYLSKNGYYLLLWTK